MPGIGLAGIVNEGLGRRIAARFSICLISLIGAAIPASALTESTVEDVPGRLVLELQIPEAGIHPAGAISGIKVTCPGCHADTRADAPDLPVYRFDVLAGPAAPTVTLQILESGTRNVPEGIAPVPRAPTPATVEYHIDAGMFRSAASASARILDRRVLRGAPVLGIEVPLALWSESGRILTLIKRVRIQMDFPGALARPAAQPLDARFLKAVKNPSGGAYLYASPIQTAHGLAKAAAAGELLGNRFIRIKVGDNNLESFDEDKVYGLSFQDLAGARGMSGELNGVKIRNLRLLTGPDDTLQRHMENGSASSGNLREIPIEVVDRDNNGTFDGDDSIRFFGHGTSIWKRMDTVVARIRYEFSADPYSFDNFYFLDFSSRDGLDGGMRLETSAPTPQASAPLASTYAYLHAERDLETSACDPSNHKDEETGFDWYWYWKGACTYGPTKATLTSANLRREETALLPNLLQTGNKDSLFLGFFTYGARSDAEYTAYYGGGGDTLLPYDNPGSKGAWFVWTNPVKSSAGLELDRLEWNGSEKRFEGYSVCYLRKHVFSGQPFWIFPPETGKAVSYQVEVTGGGVTGVKCLRVEDGVPTRLMALDGEGIFTDSLANGAQARYYVYRTAVPLAAQNLSADGLPPTGGALRNLGSGDGKNPEYLILTDRTLLAPALSLRDYRNEPARALHVKTEVVLLEDVYRQFSGGRLSPPAIRDFLRHAYRGWGNQAQAGKLKYVLFFGDGHYDYRNIRANLQKSAPPNIVPPYEFIVDGGREEVASDDFYSLLDAGDFGYNGGMLDIATGRVPVQTVSEATAYLKKVADYENPALAGEWRARVVFAADDNIQRGSPKDQDPISRGHTTDSDEMGARIAANEKGTTVDKVYLLDYPINSAFHKPEAAQDLLSFINRGSLMINYVGHGASNQWADEVLMQTNDAISRMRNEGRTPMVNAFSCTVGRFESLTSEGMSEQLVKEKRVGAIAAVSSTRESFPQPNITLANSFYSRVFPPDSSGLVVTAGDALRDAKNSSETIGDNLNDLKYQLLGEPVLLLRKPQLGIALTQVMDTIKALDCSVIKGRIIGGSGSGKVNIKIVAGSVHKTYNLGSDFTPQEVDKRGNILFERTFPYVNGEFSTDYFIPKQIAFGDTNAQVLVFAWDDKMEMEGTSARQNLRIQGTAQSACATDSDGKGPRIRITGCEKKETGELDFPDRVRLSLPYCLQIHVVDSVGGVLSAQGPDEGTTLEIPGAMDPFHPLPGIDELYFKSYQLTLDKRTLQPGSHLLKVSARDGYGNISLRQMRPDRAQRAQPDEAERHHLLFRHGRADAGPRVRQS
jgi:hypothetical protein